MRKDLLAAAAEDSADGPRAAGGPGLLATSPTGKAGGPNSSAPVDTTPAKPSTTRSISPTRLLSLDLHRTRSVDRKSPDARSRRPSSTNWKTAEAGNGTVFEEDCRTAHSPLIRSASEDADGTDDKMRESRRTLRLTKPRNPWSISPLTLVTTIVAFVTLFAITHSFAWRQLDPKGCRMSYMRPAFARLDDFSTEHTRFANKYSVYLYREQLVDEDTKVKGVPVLFIPGNAGSYKQVRPIAAEAATYFHDALRTNQDAIDAGIRTLDFFTVDFNEEFTAFHGQAILDQAEYLNEAVAYILSLYHDPRRSERDSNLPDPTSVIILGHSMGGIVARTMLVMPNYQANSVNTIITMAAPHAKPPVSFDAQIVDIYQNINDYWRKAYSQQWANDNPLWHVTLLSIAGGGLDTMIPSDYASVESLVPETHGFTVFTSTVPTVWTGMDHQAILWCDQFRKIVVKALYDVVDVNRAAQTKPRADRMRAFKRWFLTGLEDATDKILPGSEPTTLLTLEDNANTILAQGETLVLRRLGQFQKSKAHLMPVPPQSSPGKRFTLLTNQKLESTGLESQLDVLFCSVFPLQPGQSSTLFSMNMDLSGESTGSTRLACKNAASDVILLPASTTTTKRPFYLDGEEDVQPLSYLEYKLENIQEHQFVAVVDRHREPTHDWVIAEFVDDAQSRVVKRDGLRQLLTFGTSFEIGSSAPMVNEVKIPAMYSSLLSYNLAIGNQACGDEGQLFTPLLRQFTVEPYESKYFVNVKQVRINLHGIAPFMPPPLKPSSGETGMSLQLWRDPTCASTMSVSLEVDMLGSAGKLFMRYRTMLAAFPLMVVAMILRQQFRTYDRTGVFVSFSEGLDTCLRRPLPLALTALSVLAIFLASSPVSPLPMDAAASDWHTNNSTTAINFAQNDLLIGSPDPFFWFLVPLLGIASIGICVVLNYAVLSLTHVFYNIYKWISLALRPSFVKHDGKQRSQSPAFSPSSPRRRILTTAVLLVLVSTLIPYQFAYLVAVLVQISTCTRALRIFQDNPSVSNANFQNYAHSILILMIWTIPAINLPILVVWVHNLAVQWFTPFSSHHNVLSIMPFILLVESLTSGKMVPRITSRLRYVTSVAFAGIAMYAAVYGVTYAYVLHHLVNGVIAWLIVIHSSTSEWTLQGIGKAFGEDGEDRKGGKTP